MTSKSTDWLSDELHSALAAEKSEVRGGPGGICGPGKLKGFKGMRRLSYFRFLPPEDVVYGDWERNHGTPWGEGPPVTHWPKEYYKCGTWKWVLEEKRTELFEVAKQAALQKRRAAKDFFTAQAAHYPVELNEGSSANEQGAGSSGDNAPGDNASAQAAPPATMTPGRLLLLMQHWHHCI